MACIVAMANRAGRSAVSGAAFVVCRGFLGGVPAMCMQLKGEEPAGFYRKPSAACRGTTAAGFTDADSWLWWHDSWMWRHDGWT